MTERAPARLARGRAQPQRVEPRRGYYWNPTGAILLSFRRVCKPTTTTWSNLGVTCKVNGKAVTCTNAAKHGFTIGNRKYKSF
jgi:hypothetical protein